MHQTKISTETDKEGFSLAVFRSRVEQKNPITECLVFCVCVDEICQDWVAVFVSIAITFYSFVLSAAKVALGQYSRVSLLKGISLWKPKANFDERISCITRHNDFSPRGHRAVSLQVAPYLRDCKSRGYRRRASQTENE